MTGELRKVTEKNLVRIAAQRAVILNSEPAEYEAGVPSTLPRYLFFELDYG
jgi:hypothetical protein